ncbi:MAG: alpha-hydroxy-acid oxidizing protein [Clostridia bacterium]|nr:alpha-hydroxy-acid oxidizing protein [Clostridia bacterium]
MAVQFVREDKGPAVIQSINSNQISDAYRDSITIAYQFVGSTVPDVRFTLNGRAYDTPIMAGPIGLGDKNGGLIAYARGVEKGGGLFWSHYHDFEGWDQVLKAGIPAVRVIKPLRDMNRFSEEAKKDEERGAQGIAMDIDHGLTVYGELDEQQEPFGPKTIEDLRKISQATKLPFYIKGIISVHDALMAQEAGAAGIVISGHNNRFPCAVPPLKMLPVIRKAMGKNMKLFVDGGLNTGYDVFKALALGADAVLCARTLASAFVKGGEDGLSMRIAELTAELKGAMANTGSKDLQHINQNSLVLPFR